MISVYMMLLLSLCPEWRIRNKNVALYINNTNYKRVNSITDSIIYTTIPLMKIKASEFILNTSFKYNFIQSLCVPSFLSTNPHVYMSDHTNFEIKKNIYKKKVLWNWNHFVAWLFRVWKWEIESHLVAICKLFLCRFVGKNMFKMQKKCRFPIFNSMYKVRKGLWSVFPWNVVSVLNCYERISEVLICCGVLMKSRDGKVWSGLFQ